MRTYFHDKAKTRARIFTVGLEAVVVTTFALAVTQPSVQAADHIDAPTAQGDAPADITDFYAWHDGDRIVAAIAFSGLSTPGTGGAYDDQMLYGIHVDQDGDAQADETVWVRFGQSAGEQWGVKFENIPGSTGDVMGPVEEELDIGLGLRAWAGVRDDPFFFDFDGFLATLDSGALSFDSTRDYFRNTNVTMIVVEMSIDAAAAGSDTVQLWATTSRKGG